MVRHFSFSGVKAFPGHQQSVNREHIKIPLNLNSITNFALANILASKMFLGL